MRLFDYDTNIYDFRKLVSGYLDIENLNQLHKMYSLDLLNENTDQSTIVHRKFYDGMDSDNRFIKLYDTFINDNVSLLHNDEILYQTYPTFRVHVPNNICVFKWHKDKEFNHNPKEINYFLPLTDSFGNNSIWLESEEDLGDFTPIKSYYGQLIEFNGANCRHGNKINDTEITRVSFDFRILKLKDYKNTELSSKSKNTKFVIGEYYKNAK